MTSRGIFGTYVTPTRFIPLVGDDQKQDDPAVIDTSLSPRWMAFWETLTPRQQSQLLALAERTDTPLENLLVFLARE